MPIEPLSIIGAGGHAKVVIDALISSGTPLAGQHLLGIRIETPEWPEATTGMSCHVAIGDNRVRIKLLTIARTTGAQLRTVIHPSAVIALRADIGAGSLIAAHTYIGPDARIGAGCIINNGAVVDHDCVVGDGCHIAPNATLGGGAHIGAGVLIGAGAVVLPGLRVSEGVTLGAGATLTTDADTPGTWVGTPARRIIA